MKLRSPFIRQHFRHTAVLWLTLRISLTGAMLWAMQGSDIELDSLYGPGIGVFTVIITVIVAALDRQRIGPALRPLAERLVVDEDFPQQDGDGRRDSRPHEGVDLRLARLCNHQIATGL